MPVSGNAEPEITYVRETPRRRWPWILAALVAIPVLLFAGGRLDADKYMGGGKSPRRAAPPAANVDQDDAATPDTSDSDVEVDWVLCDETTPHPKGHPEILVLAGIESPKSKLGEEVFYLRFPKNAQQYDVFCTRDEGPHDFEIVEDAEMNRRGDKCYVDGVHDEELEVRSICIDGDGEPIHTGMFNDKFNAEYKDIDDLEDVESACCSWRTEDACEKRGKKNKDRDAVASND